MLEKQHVVIIGGAGLIGKCFAEAVSKAGAKVTIADIDVDKTQKVIEEISTSGCIEAQMVDITDQTSVLSMIARAEESQGTITSVINNAYPRNKNYGRKLEQVSYEDFCENLSLHLGGYFLTTKCFAEYFSDKEDLLGNIINISSIYGSLIPRFELYENTSMTVPIEYTCIKSALINMTKYFSKYYKGKGIRFNCLSPGGVLDGQNEEFLSQYNKMSMSKGMLDPSDLAGSLLYLLSSASEYVNGQNIIVDDGFSL